MTGLAKGYPRWPVIPLAGAAFVAIWGGWVDLGRMAGFGTVNLLPGIADVRVDLAITLPLGMEVYAAYAMGAWLTSRPISKETRTFAQWSAIVALVFGAVGQVAYHLMISLGIERAPWQIVIVVACLPVAVLGMGSALAHRLHADAQRRTATATVDVAPGETQEAPTQSVPAPAPQAAEPARMASPKRSAPTTAEVPTLTGPSPSPSPPRPSAARVVPGEVPAALTELRDWVVDQVLEGKPVTGGSAFRAGKATSERVARRNLNTLRETAPEIFEGSLHLVRTTREMAL